MAWLSRGGRGGPKIKLIVVTIVVARVQSRIAAAKVGPLLSDHYNVKG